MGYRGHFTIATTEKIEGTGLLAVVSALSGLAAFLCGAAGFILYSLPGTAGSLIFLTDGILLPLRGLSGTIALLTGAASLILMQKQKTGGKFRLFAWIGIALGAGWILLGILVGAAFFLGEILHGS